jgi:hypothetical protein
MMASAAAAAAATVVFVDVRFYEDKRGINDIRYRAKVASSTAHQLNDVIKKAAGSLVKHISEGGEDDTVGDDAVDSVLKRIKKVSCNGMDLSDFVNDPSATLQLLNSNDSPIFTKGLDIHLPKDINNSSEPPTKKTKIDAFARKGPIDMLGDKFSRLTTGGRNVIVRPRVSPNEVTTLHSHLSEIDPDYCPAIKTKEHLGKVPLLVAFIGHHAVDHTYMFDLIKCKNAACCGELKTPLEFQELALQRQPTPRKDPTREGHFYRRTEALKLFAGDAAAFTNLSDLPSHKSGDGKQSKKDKEKRDTEMAKKLGRNIWQAKSVRSFLTCFNCAKRRCIYSPRQAGYAREAGTLKQKLELVSGRYSCGDLLFDDSDPLSEVLVQKLNLTCESQIEKGYYNNAERSLKLQDICIHCGEMEESGSTGTFLLGQKQLEERCLTGGYKCLPICVDCIEMKRKVVTMGGKKSEVKAREERARQSR